MFIGYFTTVFSFIDTVMHLCSWPLCNRHTINWRASWKNGISSTSMKLRKSLVKPVTRRNISSCSVLSPEIVMHDAFNVILWTSADKCVIMQLMFCVRLGLGLRVVVRIRVLVEWWKDITTGPGEAGGVIRNTQCVSSCVILVMTF